MSYKITKHVAVTGTEGSIKGAGHCRLRLTGVREWGLVEITVEVEGPGACTMAMGKAFTRIWHAEEGTKYEEWVGWLDNGTSSYWNFLCSVVEPYATFPYFKAEVITGVTVKE